MSERKAVYYGQVTLVPGISCDGYVLDDGTAVMSERGTTDLLGMYHKALQSMATNWPPKTLEPFVDKDLSMATNLVEVIASNSPYKGRKIVVYTSQVIESLIRGYALAFAHDSLRQNQRHIGKRCVILQSLLVRTALDAAIKEACGFIPEIQKTAQKDYNDAVALIQDMGFTCSLANNIATKKDIASFLKVPESTLNSYLRKHDEDIKPIPLDIATIQSLGVKAKRMNGYSLNDVAKITFGMDTETGLEAKRRMFGPIGLFLKTETKEEIQWSEKLSKVFKGFQIYRNHSIGKYRADFFVPELMLVLECNGYCHRYYNHKKEEKREKFISKRYGLVRFHHKIEWEALVNGILNAKPGKLVRCDLDSITQVV